MNTTTYILVMLMLLLLSRFFSASETAFSSVNTARLKLLSEKGNRGAKRALRLAENYDRLLSALLIGNNIVNITLASIGTIFFTSLLGSIGATVSTVVITVVVLIFGEVTPKSLAKDQPEKFSIISAPFIWGLMILFTPFIKLFTLWKYAISKLLHVPGEQKMTQEELRVLVDEAAEDGGIPDMESKLLQNALSFSSGKTAEDILTPRVALSGVPTNADRETIAKTFTETRYSRLLVYEGSMDNIHGILNQKDFYNGMGVTEKPLSEIITMPLFIPATMQISELLAQMQGRKVHISVVIDDYGGTLGIVTLEDILEELVGEIWDEHDEVTESIHPVTETMCRVLGSTPLFELYTHFDRKAPEEPSTINGLASFVLGRIPVSGDSFTYDGFSYQIKSADARHVIDAEVTMLPKDPDEDE